MQLELVLVLPWGDLFTAVGVGVAGVLDLESVSKPKLMPTPTATVAMKTTRVMAIILIIELTPDWFLIGFVAAALATSGLVVSVASEVTAEASSPVCTTNWDKSTSPAAWVEVSESVALDPSVAVSAGVTVISSVVLRLSPLHLWFQFRLRVLFVCVFCHGRCFLCLYYNWFWLSYYGC